MTQEFGLEEISSNSSESGIIENLDSSKSNEEIDVGSADSVQSTQPIKNEEIARENRDTPRTENVRSDWTQPNANFNTLITELCGKDLFRVIEWFKSNPLFATHSNESKVSQRVFPRNTVRNN